MIVETEIGIATMTGTNVGTETMTATKGGTMIATGIGTGKGDGTVMTKRIRGGTMTRIGGETTTGIGDGTGTGMIDEIGTGTGGVDISITRTVGHLTLRQVFSILYPMRLCCYCWIIQYKTCQLCVGNCSQTIYCVCTTNHTCQPIGP
jgi:hypothetical protein